MLVRISINKVSNMFGQIYRNPGPSGMKGDVEISCVVYLWKGQDQIGFHFGPIGQTVQKIDVPVYWGLADIVELRISVSYNLIRHNSGLNTKGMFLLGEGEFSFSQKWRIYYQKDGLHLLPLAEVTTPPDIDEDDISVQASMGRDNSPLWDQDPFVSATINLAGGLQSDGISVGFMGVGTTIGASKNSFKIGNGLRLTASLKLTGQPKPSAPRLASRPPVDLKIPRELLKHTITFETENQEFAGATELRRLEDKWYDELLRKSPQIHNAIAKGDCPIKLDGFTSTTGSLEYNQKLSAKRIEAVASAIQSLFPTSAKIAYRPKVPHGKSLAQSSGPAAHERRVVLSISETDATWAYADEK